MGNKQNKEMGAFQCVECDDEIEGPPDLRTSEGVSLRREKRQLESVMPSMNNNTSKQFQLQNGLKPILGYWNMRGEAQQIRFLLIYLGVDFEDSTYDQGNYPDYSTSQWDDTKGDLGLDDPSLPYFIDLENDVKLTNTL